MTTKQRKFVEAYQGKANGNATEAARLAGYKGSDSTLGRVGHDNTRNPKIAALLKEHQESDPLVADREERQRFLTQTMRGVQVLTLNGEKTEMPVDIKERLKACDLLAKTGGDYGAKGTADDPVHHTHALGWTDDD